MTSLSNSYSIKQIVDEAILSLPQNQQSEREYDRFLNFALSGLRRLRVMVTKDGIKRVKIEPNSLNRYDFPDDMESFVSLYVPMNGTIWELTEDKNIIPTKTVVGQDESQDEDYGEGVSLPVAQYNTFASQGGINREGYFTIDYENREIVINSNRTSELVLKYTTLGSTTIIPTTYVEALKAWIYWKDVERDRTVPLNTKLQYQQSFKDEVRNIKKIEGPGLTQWFEAWSRKSLVR